MSAKSEKTGACEMEKKSLHLSFEKITDLALGASAGAEMSEHLKSCPQCELEMNLL